MKKHVLIATILITVCLKQLTIAQTLPDNHSIRFYDTLRYGLFVPDPYDPNEEYPLITYLHGANDTATKYLNWYTDDVQSVNPCFVITPRCPPGPGSWGNSWQEELTPHIELTLELVDSMISEFSIDTNRLYIYGTSMGGFGTLNVLYHQPGRYAAAMVLCGGGNPETWEEVSQTPVWFFHGTEDASVPIEYSRDLYDTMMAHGVKRARYIEYPGVGHNMWDYADLETSWPDWMFHFSRTDDFNEEPDAPIVISSEVTEANERLYISWSDIDDREDRKNKIWYYKLFRNGVLKRIQEYDDVDYFDRSPEEGMNTYRVTAVNYDFYESDSSNITSIQLPEIQNSDDIPYNGFNVYPNPANNYVTIISKYPVERLEVLDLYGRMVMDINGNQQQEVDVELNQINSGMYVIRVYSGKDISVKQIMIQ